MTYALISLLAVNLALCVSLCIVVGKHATQVAEMMATHRVERTELLNRIQAPTVAVAQSMPESAPAQHVPLDDDEGFWESRKERLNGD